VTVDPTVVPERRPGAGRVAGFLIVLVGTAWALGALAAWPWRATQPGIGIVRISFRHVSGFAGAVERRSAEELARLPAHMRPLDAGRPATARRSDTRLTVTIDGATVLERTYRPTGFRRDGPVYGYEEQRVAPGTHQVTVTLADVETGTLGWTASRALPIEDGAAPLIEYQAGRGWLPGAK
jgi:hypothetical protein